MTSKTFAAIGFVFCLGMAACDSSTSSNSNTPSGGTCDGYKGTWAFDTTLSDSGDSFKIHDVAVLSAGTFTHTQSQQGGMFTTFTAVSKDVGVLTELSGSRFVAAPTTSYKYSLTAGGLAQKPSPGHADTMTYSFPSSGKMGLKDNKGKLSVYTCQ